MQRSSIFDIKNHTSTRAKTPQNSNQLNRSKRQTRSLAKPILSPFSNKKLQDKISIPFKLQSIKQSTGNNKLFYLGKGNNHQMVRKILLRRINWVQTQNKQQNIIHFKWAQSNWGYKYHLLGKQCLCVNHFQYHRQVSNKQRLVKNMINYCEYNKLNAFNYLPLTWVIDLATSDQQMSLHNFIKFYNRNIPTNNSQKRLQSLILPKIKSLSNYSQPTKRPQGLFYCQYVMPKTFIAQQDKSQYLWILKPTFMNRGRGVALFNSLEQFQKLIWKYYQGQDLQDYGNRTFNMEDFIDNQQIKQKNQQNKQKGKVQQKKPQTKTWTNSQNINNQSVSNQVNKQKNQLNNTQNNSMSNSTNNNVMSNSTTTNSNAMNNSTGTNFNTNNSTTTSKVHTQQIKVNQNQSSSNNNIQLSSNNNIQSLSNNNNNNNNNSIPSLRVLSFVVQKYIQSPMLINQRKFDIRVWAMLTQSYEIYFFKQGYLRFSSFKYSTKNHNNPFIHLTNNSVQKHSADYNQQSGNQIYLSEMKNYMPEQAYVKLQSKIRQIIYLSLMSSRRKININGRKQCFQIFGYDFMVDSLFKVWLIQVNTNPAIQDCSTVLKAMIPRMLDDAFKLSLDKIFNNKLIQNAQIFTVPGYKNQQNMWELLGDFNQGINQKIMGKKLTFLRR